MPKGRHSRAFRQAKKKRTKKHQAEPIKQQAFIDKPLEPEPPFIEEKIIAEPADTSEKTVLKRERNEAMIADLKTVATLAVAMLAVLIVLAQIMG